MQLPAMSAEPIIVPGEHQAQALAWCSPGTINREIQTTFVLTCGKVGMWEGTIRKLSRREHSFVICYSKNGFFRSQIYYN